MFSAATLIKLASLGVIALTAAILPRQFYASRFWRMFPRFDGIAQQQTTAIIVVGLIGTLGGAAFAKFIAAPDPLIHDEFSYLLAADTFSHGRLTNPPHPLGINFESSNIITRPTYASKYPPAQGLMLAVGQILTGQPIVGTWLSAGMAAAAICWMLQAWVPPRWAFVGGLLAALRFTFPDVETNFLKGIGYWSHSYWGGAVAALGGALEYGALRRLIAHPRASLAIALGAGLAILANSRPYEGLVASLPAAVLLFRWMIGKNGPSPRVALTQIVAPLVTVLALMGSWLAYYNDRVTGDPLTMPFQVHEDQYRVAPLFLWQKPRPVPHYHHEILRKLNVDEVPYGYYEQLTFGGLAVATFNKVRVLAESYLGPLLLFPLIALPWSLGKPWTKFTIAACLTLLVGLLVETWILPHYAAPLTGLNFLLVVESLRRLQLCTIWNRQPGRFFARILPLLCVLSWLIEFETLRRQPFKFSLSWHRQRAEIDRSFAAQGGKHLIIVRYEPGHSTLEEWVYNRADIDGSSVVWAREIDDAQTQTLREYFRDRRHWRLVPSGPNTKLLQLPDL